jgi:hypothetical protein
MADKAIGAGRTRPADLEPSRQFRRNLFLDYELGRDELLR